MSGVVILLLLAFAIYLALRPNRRKTLAGHARHGAAAPTQVGAAPAPPVTHGPRTNIAFLGLENPPATATPEPAPAPGPLPSVVAEQRLRKEMTKLQNALKTAPPPSVEDRTAEARRRLCAEWLDGERARVPFASLRVPGLGDSLLAALEAAGFRTLYDISSRHGWDRVPGIGEAREQAIRAADWSFRSEKEREFAALSDDEVDRTMSDRLAKATDEAEGAVLKYERDRIAAEMQLVEVWRRLAASS